VPEPVPTPTSRYASAPGEVPVVRADELVVGYDGVPVCAPATFEVRAGQAVAVVGSNGSGKSTLLRAVLGLLVPVAGRVQVLGADVDERTARFRESVAGVLDEDAWFPGLTVREHLYLTARGHGVMRAEAVVAALVDELGLADVERAVPGALSSGQRRRLLLASAFVRPRALLVLDEPEQRLDRDARDVLVGRLLAEKASGGAVLLATHDADLVRAVADAAVLPADDRTSVLDASEAADLIARSPG
jgi:ABC-2 type transport system ATP-binding protein